ncbi:MAG TPA: HD domain-containing protein [Atribacteraceae bacterium]|nr:HD domain-containing protein [Atribacteraceae bacterium]
MEDNEYYWKAVHSVFVEDPSMIEHTREVIEHALALCTELNCDDVTKKIVFLSALLHDIGICEAFRKHGSREGKYQHIEGPPIARKILEEGREDPSISERVIYLVGNHHNFDNVDDLDFQILIEADMLVNLREENLTPRELNDFIEHFFKTDSGKKRARSLYLGF